MFLNIYFCFNWNVKGLLHVALQKDKLIYMNKIEEMIHKICCSGLQ